MTASTQLTLKPKPIYDLPRLSRKTSTTATNRSGHAWPGFENERSACARAARILTHYPAMIYHSKARNPNGINDAVRKKRSQPNDAWDPTSERSYSGYTGRTTGQAAKIIR